MKKQIWVSSHPLAPPAPGQPSKPEGAEEIQVKGHQQEVVGLRLGTDGGRARTPVDQAWGSISQSLLLPPLSAPWPHPGHAHWDMPGPGFPGAIGSSRRGLQKPKCLSERN